MAANITDFGGQRIAAVGVLRSVDMTATTVYDWMNNGQNTVIIYAVGLSHFSAFPDGTAPPATWAFSYGTDSAVTPVNMRAAGTISAAPTTPIVIAQSMNSSTLTPYVLPRQTVYFAITTTTNGVGTFNATLFGAYLGRQY